MNDKKVALCFMNENKQIFSTRSQMISQEDFSVISRLDSGDQASRDKVVENTQVLIHICDNLLFFQINIVVLLN